MFVFIDLVHHADARTPDPAPGAVHPAAHVQTLGTGEGACDVLAPSTQQEANLHNIRSPGVFPLVLTLATRGPRGLPSLCANRPVSLSRLTLSFHIGSNTDAHSNVLIGQESAPKPPPPLKDCTCKKQVRLSASGFSY
uniref:Uncharacterized protein n=1 Tax=Timema douglasi TaxID=61478 RepID=A0A7R8VED7_TIMDO|nr:unnamed protein product [Timema douglasi]